MKTRNNGSRIVNPHERNNKNENKKKKKLRNLDKLHHVSKAVNFKADFAYLSFRIKFIPTIFISLK